jgi:hypothetical protein
MYRSEICTGEGSVRERKVYGREGTGEEVFFLC